ncbi:hypothetical protein M885DRAFT_624074 [Pelagophyceae sp. CCMP2097]|nr:hypothetical protein M885DRAFT_624074 [Pelagophyceae sp. CCMP2097]|mmetsp:Transcript_3981/g.13911  ORF Transcript_3981/g.13911 Transcript_3981/m.13911 type:complete len:631 (-) Transcript_3981:201-2093(-)
MRTVSDDEDDYGSDDADFEEDAAEQAPARPKPTASAGQRPGAARPPSAAAEDDDLARMEKRVNARLALLERVKRCDVHEACWRGDSELVQTHLELAGNQASAGSRLELKVSKRNLKSLEAEAAEMSNKGDGDDDCAADEAEISVAYAEKVETLRDSVESATSKVARDSAKGAEDCANAIDVSEFAEGYRPLHYAAYAGHAEVVKLLLDARARPAEVNGAGCTPLFLATQQGKPTVVALLLQADDNLCHKSQLASSGDGRSLCALDAARANDSSKTRQKCRRLLLDKLASKKPSRAAASQAPYYLPHRPDAPLLLGRDELEVNARLGGLEVKWTAQHYTQQSGAEHASPPAHHVKVKIMDRATGAVAAVVVTRSASHCLRIACRAAGEEMGIDAGDEYVACVAFVNGAGAGPYSEPSASRAAQPPKSSADDSRRSSDDGSRSTDRPLRNVDPKIARARQAILEGRAKRQKFQEIISKDGLETRDARGARPRPLDYTPDDGAYRPGSAISADSRHRQPGSLNSAVSRLRPGIEELGPAVTLPAERFQAPQRQWVDMDAGGDDDSGVQLVSPTTSPMNQAGAPPSTRDGSEGGFGAARQHFSPSAARASLSASHASRAPPSASRTSSRGPRSP